MTTPPSRSRAGFASPTPTMRRCRSPTRRSTAPFTSRRGGRSSASSTRHLRRGRSRRYARSQSSKRQGQGKLTEMVMISERPPEVEDRAVPGHWEGDLLMGTAEARAIATLVERPTRYCSSSPCPTERRPTRSATRSSESITTLPAQLRRSLTWDQGSEMSEHRRFSVESGVEVYFCDPQSPWQRGSNENTNGLLRQYFPRRKSLAGITQEHLDEVADEAQPPPAQDARFPDPGREALRVDRRPRASRRRALTRFGLRPSLDSARTR